LFIFYDNWDILSYIGELVKRYINMRKSNNNYSAFLISWRNIKTVLNFISSELIDVIEKDTHTLWTCRISHGQNQIDVCQYLLIDARWWLMTCYEVSKPPNLSALIFNNETLLFGWNTHIYAFLSMAQYYLNAFKPALLMQWCRKET
jgi:hypothetical protein